MTPAGAAPGTGMRFSVDGWDPSYGSSMEIEGQLEESRATIDADVEVPAARWRPVDPGGRHAASAACVALFLLATNEVITECAE